MLIPIHKKGMAGKPQSESSVVISGPDIFIPAGNYKDDVNKSVEIVEQAVPSVEIDGNGLITTEASQIEGYVEEGIKSNTKQLTTQAAKTITPTTSEQTAVASGVYTTGAVKVAAMPIVGRADTSISVSADDTNDKLTITASNNQGTGYVTGANKTASKTITLTASGSTITASDGSTSISKSVATATQATPSISVSSAGLITASATQSAGYVSAGTKSATKQLTTKGATTYIPSTVDQFIPAGTLLQGEQIIKGDSELRADNIREGVSIFGVSGSVIEHEAGLPKITYLNSDGTPSNYSIIDDGNGNWRIKLLSSGILTITRLSTYNVDVLLVGGGGGGGVSSSNYNGAGGGGGGYTLTSVMTLQRDYPYSIIIGSGGPSSTSGGHTEAFGLRAYGGSPGSGWNGGSGGSGGGAGGYSNDVTAGTGGSNGSNGANVYVGWENYTNYGGSGQGHATREFGSGSGTLYSGGGSGGAGQRTDGTYGPSVAGGSGGGGNGGSRSAGGAGGLNTGGGGGGGAYGGYSGGTGGSGIVIIRNAR